MTVIGKLKTQYFKAVNYDYSLLTKQAIFYLIIAIVPFLIITYLLGYWRAGFFDVNESYVSGLLFTVLNAFVVGGKLNALGFFNKGSPEKRIRYMLIILVIFLFATGLGFLDFIIWINVPFFVYKFFSLSTEAGILFIALNDIMFWILYIASFALERDV